MNEGIASHQKSESVTKFERRFSFWAGALVRKYIISEIHNYCFFNNIECDITETRGFPESRIFVILKGDDEEKLYYFINLFINWCNDDEHRSSPISLSTFENLRQNPPEEVDAHVIGVFVFTLLAILIFYICITN